MSSNQPNSKPDLYVVARIINVLKNKGRIKRTELATSTGVAYDRLTKYVDWMNQEGLLKIDEEGNIKLTDLGLETYDKLVKWILQYVGKLKFPRF
ncbi:MAG TPA: winged helix-turn-helix domain-containing protein [Candidatus Bathyarchaeia archaeon]|nr:winged helix-turn-helix domain-containing protein [Candidatus Bathyarchaeia archaeon]